MHIVAKKEGVAKFLLILIFIVCNEFSYGIVVELPKGL
jgi:hypothetical protein